MFYSLKFSLVLLFMKHTLRKKWRFPLRISSVNVTKPAVSSRFAHIYRRNPLRKSSFFVQWYIQRCIQNPFSSKLFLQKAPFWIFSRVLNPLLIWTDRIIIKKIDTNIYNGSFSNHKRCYLNILYFQQHLIKPPV